MVQTAAFLEHVQQKVKIVPTTTCNPAVMELGYTNPLWLSPMAIQLASLVEEYVLLQTSRRASIMNKATNPSPL